jgi:hypothetical protein
MRQSSVCTLEVMKDEDVTAASDLMQSNFSETRCNGVRSQTRRVMQLTESQVSASTEFHRDN